MKGNTEEMMDEKGVGGSEYHTNNLLGGIEDYHIRMNALVASASYSNGVIVSESEGWDILPCPWLEYEEAIVLAVDEKEEESSGDSRNYGP